jgi:hypothetical protein
VDRAGVERLRAALAASAVGSALLDRALGLGRALRTAPHDPGGLLVVGTPDHDPWHLAAHLADEARFGTAPSLAPTLVRWAPPADAPPHLAVGLERVERAARGETLLVVSPEVAVAPLLERVADARRAGALVLALQGDDPELTGLAHDAVVVPPGGPDLDAVGHLVSAVGAPPRRRRLFR